MNKFIKDLLTEINGEKFDVARVLWILGVLVYIGLSIAAVIIKGQLWDPVNYGIGFGAVLAGGGAALALKKDAPTGIASGITANSTPEK